MKVIDNKFESMVLIDPSLYQLVAQHLQTIESTRANMIQIEARKNIRSYEDKIKNPDDICLKLKEREQK